MKHAAIEPQVSVPVWVSTALRRSRLPSSSSSRSMFQSRCGFLPPCDGFPTVRTRGSSSCFNPGVGFYRIATARAVRSRGTSLVFQSRCGFLPHRDYPVHRSVRSGCGSFNPGVGFYRIATRAGRRPARRLTHSFQSRCGFLPHRDGRFVGVGEAEVQVSIPVWVSTASRPVGRSRAVAHFRCFNPGVGFYRIATDRAIDLDGVDREFQSRCGFLPHRDLTMSGDFYAVPGEFQSRCGFLPHRDVRGPEHEIQLQKFQSRCGFLPHRDNWNYSTSSIVRACFNPGVGFYRIAT